MKVNILGVKIDDVKMVNALETVYGYLKGKKKHYIVTPNPEIIMTAQKDEKYKGILNDADLSIPDGVGLKFSGQVKHTFAGIDFMEKLVEHSIVWGSTVGLIGGRGSVAEKCADCLRKKYPGVRIVYADNGGEIDEQGEWVEGNRKALIPLDILFVGFGPPKQEYWISKNIKKLDIKIMMGVGGSFDYLSGVVPRAPKLIRSLGFEWLFRLIVQPWRIKRQLTLIKYVLLLM